MLFPIILVQICEKDEGALAFLKDIEWSMVDTESFKIDFFFEKSNPFFSNPVLTKTYYYMLRHEIVLGTEGSLIEWYPGKSLTENTTRKKVIDKRAAVLSAKNKEPMIETEEESFSFFNFFSPLEVLMADHQAQEAKQLMQDYRIGGPDESFQSLNPSTELQRRVIALREIQQGEGSSRSKYQKIYYPLYEQRFKIVIGVVEGEGNDGTQNLGVGRDEDKGIPSFWLRCGVRDAGRVSLQL
nr:nucleosome assembly protein 1;3-like [Ipomoea trifida]